jgi:hypothetical protein
MSTRKMTEMEHAYAILVEKAGELAKAAETAEEKEAECVRLKGQTEAAAKVLQCHGYPGVDIAADIEALFVYIGGLQSELADRIRREPSKMPVPSGEDAAEWIEKVSVALGTYYDCDGPFCAAEAAFVVGVIERLKERAGPEQMVVERKVPAPSCSGCGRDATVVDPRNGAMRCADHPGCAFPAAKPDAPGGFEVGDNVEWRSRLNGNDTFRAVITAVTPSTISSETAEGARRTFRRDIHTAEWRSGAMTLHMLLKQAAGLSDKK